MTERPNGQHNRRYKGSHSKLRPQVSDTRDEMEYLLRHPADPDSPIHLSSKSSVLNYIRFADEVRRFLPRDGHVLDWGCGFGQVSWLLARRGLVVTSFDIQRLSPHKLIIDADQILIGDDPVVLPFPEASFDAVVSCGVLEHVVDERASLQEIRRILQPGGFFFIYQLPQRYAYTELINRWRSGRWHHPRRYTPRGIRRELEAAGFRLLQQRRANFFPKNLTGLPAPARNAYNLVAYMVNSADLSLARVPLLNLLCHSLEIVADVQG